MRSGLTRIGGSILLPPTAASGYYRHLSSVLTSSLDLITAFKWPTTQPEGRNTSKELSKECMGQLGMFHLILVVCDALKIREIVLSEPLI